MHTRPYNLSRRLLLPLLALLIGLSAMGCGGGMADVSGKVTYKTQPLKTGTIQFMGSDGLPYSAQIGSDGTYSTKVRAGEAKVLINCIDDSKMVEYVKAMSAAGRGKKEGPRQPPPRSGMPGSGPNFSLIPQRYSNWESSGLSATIKSGKNTDVNFELTD